MSESILRTPLYDEHIRLGGRMVPFAGYEMPVQYGGIIAESRAVRESCGMFDVSHMARLSLEGDSSLEFLEWVTSNDVSKLEDGTGQYSLLPNDAGGTIDDIIVYRLNADRFRMVVNASNHAKDVAWLSAQNRFGVAITDQTDATAMIAVQGPQSQEILAAMSDAPEALKAAPMFGVVHCQIGGVACFAPRSGYTGEDGFELICDARDATALWRELLNAGVVACGLGARDVLRVEAGLPLYGHELTDDLSPIAAGLGWVISKTKPFIGSEPIGEARANGVPRKLMGVQLDSKRLLTPGMDVLVGGQSVGSVSSGVVSPVLDCAIAMAFVDSGVAIGTECAIDIRGKAEPGRIVSKRFLKSAR